MNIFLKSAGKQEGTPCVSNMVQLGDFFYLSGQTGLRRKHSGTNNYSYQ